MAPEMSDTWSTISSLATGGGTLVLAVATFASVRSANRSARVAEQALAVQRRPVLVHSRLEDPDQKIMFMEGRWVRVAGSGAAVEHDNDVIYLALSLRNVGLGIAVLQRWWVRPSLAFGRVPPTAPEDMRLQSRDLYVPGGDIGLWQGALRDRSDPLHNEVARAIDARQGLTIELLYSDHEGGQPVISRFSVTPAGDDRWIAQAGRHWYLDRDNPREASHDPVPAEPTPA
jgi:hypothetical protein